MTDTDPMGTPDPTPSRIPDARRCTATNKSGGRCGQRAIPGGHVCKFHGGAAPQVKRKAQLRLAELVDPAIAQLARMLTQADKDSDKLRAAENILDRAGYGRSATVEVDDKREFILAQIGAIQARREEDIQDAEIVDEDPYTDPTTEETT